MLRAEDFKTEHLKSEDSNYALCAGSPIKLTEMKQPHGGQIPQHFELL